MNDPLMKPDPDAPDLTYEDVVIALWVVVMALTAFDFVLLSLR